MDKDKSSNFFDTGVWGADPPDCPHDKWDDYSGSNPLGDTETAKDTIEGNIQGPVDKRWRWNPDTSETLNPDKEKEKK